MFPKLIAHQKEDNGFKYSYGVPPLLFDSTYCSEKTHIQENLGPSERECKGMLGFIKSFSGETGVLQSGCMFSEDFAAVMMIESDVCLVAAASALRAAAQMSVGFKPYVRQT